MENDEVLERFMKEFFPYADCKKAGLFTKEMKGDYQAQANKICEWFGFDSVYEYGSEEIRCHISEGETDKPFITVIPSIYETEKLRY
jgi:hypothetical protein